MGFIHHCDAESTGLHHIAQAYTVAASLPGAQHQRQVEHGDNAPWSNSSG